MFSGRIDSTAQHLLGELFADLSRDSDAIVSDLADLQFAFNNFFDVPMCFLKCAENLRRATQRIRVLDFRPSIHAFGL